MCSIYLHINKKTGEIKPDTNKEHGSKDQVLYPARYGPYSIGGCQVLCHLFKAMIYSTAPIAKPKQMETGRNIGHVYKMENGNYNTELLGWSLLKTSVPITTSKLKVNWQCSLRHRPFHSGPFQYNLDGQGPHKQPLCYHSVSVSLYEYVHHSHL